MPSSVLSEAFAEVAEPSKSSNNEQDENAPSEALQVVTIEGDVRSSSKHVDGSIDEAIRTPDNALPMVPIEDTVCSTSEFADESVDQENRAPNNALPMDSSAKFVPVDSIVGVTKKEVKPINASESLPKQWTRKPYVHLKRLLKTNVAHGGVKTTAPVNMLLVNSDAAKPDQFVDGSIDGKNRAPNNTSPIASNVDEKANQMTAAVLPPTQPKRKREKLGHLELLERGGIERRSTRFSQSFTRLNYGLIECCVCKKRST